MATKEQIEALREGIEELARTLDVEPAEAWESASLPEWIWKEMADARDAVGPDKRPRMNLLATDTPERQAAADRVYAEIRSAVLEAP